MIRTYTVKELEILSGLTRRTIGDYVSKGLLAGPSHRGRGACYSQKDADILQVIPRLRVLMKKEFPTLRALRTFLAELSSIDLHRLARKTNADAFVLAVRELRLRLLLTAMFPQVSAQRIEEVLSALTPEQVRAVDGGRSQLGSVVDISELLQEGPISSGNGHNHADIGGDAAGSRSNGNGHSHRQANGNGALAHDASGSGKSSSDSSWSVSWLQVPADNHDDIPGQAAGRPDGFPDLFSKAPRPHGNAADDFLGLSRDAKADRLSDISRRLERLERLLATD